MLIYLCLSKHLLRYPLSFLTSQHLLLRSWPQIISSINPVSIADHPLTPIKTLYSVRPPPFPMQLRPVPGRAAFYQFRAEPRAESGGADIIYIFIYREGLG